MRRILGGSRGAATTLAAVLGLRAKLVDGFSWIPASLASRLLRLLPVHAEQP
jgi:hypothetical protein